MKYTIKYTLSIICLLLAVLTHAQAPQGIPYQAAARNSSGAVLASTNISVRFTIRDSIATGAIKYRETHSVTTSAQGMFSLNVGQGSPVAGTFSGINWGKNAKFMQVELDPAGGSSYIDMGTQQMMSVPYSLYSNAINPTVSATGDSVFFGGGKFIIFPGVSAANSAPYAGTITGASSVCAGSTITLANAVTGGSWSSSNTTVATVGSTGIVTGVAAGTTTISYTVTNSFGSSYVTKVVTVNALPNSGTVTGVNGVCVGSTNTLTSSVAGGTWSSSNTAILTVSSTGVVTGVAAGTATVSYTVTNSCGTAVATKVQTVNISSSIVGITGTGTVCAGSTTTLSHVTAGGTWSSNATAIATVGSTGIVTGIAAGTATISYIVHFAFCGTSSAYATRVVTVNPLPNTGTITGTTTVCAGSTTALSNATTGGVWSSGATAIATINSTGIVSGVAAGTSTISYTLTNSCGSASATRVVTVSVTPSAGTITGAATVTVGSTTTLINTTTGGTWSSSSASIATVGSTGVVTGVAAGTSTITYRVSNTCGSAVTTKVVTVTVSVAPLTIGATYGGGKIAYILEPGDPGYIYGETHGLIAAPTDHSAGLPWGCDGSTVGGTSTAWGAGAANTVLVSAACGAGTAARYCADLVLGGYSDWYLPSIDELEKLYINRISIGGFAIGTYYSSSEADEFLASVILFGDGSYFDEGYPYYDSKSGAGYVRAVRSF